MNNSDVIVRTLQKAGVRWVFGVPSGPVLPLIEALRQSSIEFILTASETSAAFMATTVGYLTGVPGVCVSTVGPGATNFTTGVGCAWLDRAPVLAITCNVAHAVARAAHPNAHRSSCAFQTADQSDVVFARQSDPRDGGAGDRDRDARNRPGRCISICRRTSRCRCKATSLQRRSRRTVVRIFPAKSCEL